MSRPGWVLVFSLVVAFATWGFGCGGPPSQRGAGCSSDEQCRPDARCSSHSCVLNAAPRADFAVSGNLEASSLVTLDGSASRDPDHDDKIMSYLWSIDADGAPCAPPEVAGTDPVVQVRFGCAGLFRARLIVVDAKHVESAPATRPLQIQGRSAPALVEAGPDQSVDHVCSGTPVTCRLGTAVRLTATTTSETPLAFRWSLQPPPGRELDAHRRARFIPDASAPSPMVEIETDGAAMSGDWQFRVEVMDGAGVLDADVARISVTNHAPVIRGGPSAEFDHVYDAPSRLFTAGGSFPVEVVDEDGDPVERQPAFHHAGDGGASFLGQDLGTAIRFTVAVPSTRPEDALFLRGGDGLHRSVAFSATDVNGGSTAVDFPVVIGNRLPVLAGSPSLSAQHSYDPNAQRFRSEPSVGRWLDPDGDPLAYAIGTDPECPTFAIREDGTVQVQCSRAFTGVASLAGFLRERQAQVSVQDPWAGTVSTPTFRIGNRAPLVDSSTYRPAAECRFYAVSGPWCQILENVRVPANLFPAGTVYAPLRVSDPDGDPVEVRPGPGGAPASCSPDLACTFAVFTPQAISCERTPPDMLVPLVVTDGIASSPGSVLLDPVCR